MTRYISQPVPVDRAAVRTEMEDSLTADAPGLEIPAGSLLDFLLDTSASNSAEDRELFTDVLAIIFRYSGEKIDRVAQRDAVAATGLSTWTRTSADEAAVGPRTVSAGTGLNLTGTDGEPRAFRTVADFTFADGVLTTTAGEVEIIAVVSGTDGNGLQAGAAPAQTLTWLDTITVTAPTSGGADAEDDDDYLDRLSDTRPLQLNAISVADDLARWLRNQTGVSRALALDNQNGATTGVAGHITAVPVDDSGAALSSDDMTALQTAAQAITLTNLQVHIVAPTYTTITVVFTGVAKTGWDATDVEARAETAVLDFLDPSSWGLPESGDERIWTDKTTVRYQDILTVLNNVEGFDRVTGTAPDALDLTINGGRVDVEMTGPGALPASDSTATGTVTAS